MRMCLKIKIRGCQTMPSGYYFKVAIRLYLGNVMNLDILGNVFAKLPNLRAVFNSAGTETQIDPRP